MFVAESSLDVALFLTSPLFSVLIVGYERVCFGLTVVQYMH